MRYQCCGFDGFVEPAALGVVLFAAPIIAKLAHLLTREEKIGDF